ncbi:hypothetical protein [Hymenobacter sp. GOD-10R]|uniref:hypothetical protein n=1 Tax=Hymenobacter sp. GOD-10R TaxID=3093922 RepID=UPI002D7965E1|nr:hypothetical protein [Hymenobacter sp. GOD-10R]WRQ26695.1 hypothetical protein SD425_16605 [Hymenobacter sp. GOD-10R]
MKQSTAVSLATGATDLGKMKLLLVDIQSGLTRQAAYAAPKLFQVKRNLGEKETLKLLVFTLKAFQDSLKVKEGMEAADLIECAEMVLLKYSHDSLKDVMLALKEAKWNGTTFYNALSVQTVMEVLNKYFDAKAVELEAEHRQQKAQPAPDMLASLSPEDAAKFKQAIAPEKPAFDEDEYRRYRAEWAAEQTRQTMEVTPEPDQEAPAA